MKKSFLIRPHQSSEFLFLKEMFYTALHVPEGVAPFPKSIIEEPSLAKYIADWGRSDDIALVAESEGELIGAVWCRLLKAFEKGYGYVNDETPELSLAIKDGFRNQGVGSQLIERAFLALKNQGFQQVSLSVDKDNKAVSLYKRLAFEIVAEEETAYTMKKTL